MGRYDGDYYEPQVPCRPAEHRFAPNGHCYQCDWTRETLVSRAHETLRLLDPQRQDGSAQ